MTMVDSMVYHSSLHECQTNIVEYQCFWKKISWPLHEWALIFHPSTIKHYINFNTLTGRLTAWVNFPIETGCWRVPPSGSRRVSEHTLLNSYYWFDWELLNSLFHGYISSVCKVLSFQGPRTGTCLFPIQVLDITPALHWDGTERKCVNWCDLCVKFLLGLSAFDTN